jgi:hypothetical protein
MDEILALIEDARDFAPGSPVRILGRADVQAYLFYKLVTDSRGFSYARGRTYLFAAKLAIPGWLLLSGRRAG